MLSTEHKVLLHGAEFIAAAALLFELFSNETQKNRNKDYKCYISNFTRKCSRRATNEDLFHKILESSDSYHPYLRFELKRKHLSIFKKALELLVEFLLINSVVNFSKSALLLFTFTCK